MSENNVKAKKRQRKEGKQKSLNKEKEAIHSVDEGSTGQKKRKNQGQQPYLVDAYHPQRPYMISVAVAGTVLDNAVTPQRKAYLAGQIARAISVFNVDEIIIYNDQGSFEESEGCKLLEILLTHLECPPYLKKLVFGMMPEFQYIGLIPPLCLPYHFTKHEVEQYRDGAMTNKSGYVDVGLQGKVHCTMELPEGTRVTVKIHNYEDSMKPKSKLTGDIVSPAEAKRVTGKYWGYSVRRSERVIDILSDSKYDCVIGTSDLGVSVAHMETINNGLPFKNLLILFGGVDGLESCNDFVHDTEQIFRSRFKHYINARPSQGTKTIRTEDAIILTLAALEPVLRTSQAKLRVQT